MISQSDCTCKFEHLKIVTFYNCWHLKAALIVGEVAILKVTEVASPLSVVEVAIFEVTEVASEG